MGLPPRSFGTNGHSSDLVFNYEASPFSFWITRRADPHAFPLFDTRIASLPKTPVSDVIPDVPSTSLDGFPLIFEDRYLQVRVDYLPQHKHPKAFGRLLLRFHSMPTSMAWARLLPVAGSDEISGEALPMDLSKRCGIETALTRSMKTCMGIRFIPNGFLTSRGILQGMAATQSISSIASTKMRSRLNLMVFTCTGNRPTRSMFAVTDTDSQRCGIRCALVNTSGITYLIDPIQNAGRNS